MRDRHVFSDDADYFISTSLRGARAMQAKIYGECPVDAEDWYEMSNDAEMRIWIDLDDSSLSLGKVAQHYDGTLVIGQMRDWIENFGPGFLCSTEY